MALKPLTDYSFFMKVVKDLGMKKPTPNYYKKVRMALFECSHCKEHFEAVITKKAQNQKYCQKCLGESKKKPLRNHPLYKVWTDTRGKLVCKSKGREVPYHSKNITICKEWEESFETFYTWAMSSGWRKGLTLDRVNNDGNYSPSNCRWADYSVQSANQRVIKANNTSGYRGVSKISDTKWVANIRFKGKHYGLGSFNDPLVAAKAYDSFVKLMDWPHSVNQLLVKGEIVLPTNRTTVKYLEGLGIYGSNTISKEP